MAYPNSIDATLFHDRFDPVDMAAMAQSVNGVMAPLGLTFQIAAPQPGEDACLEGDELSLGLVFSSKPASSTHYTRAIQSSYAEINGQNWDSRLRQHRQHIRLTVHALHSPDRSTYDNMLALAQVAVNHLTLMDAPEAIHWGQSDQMFEPDTFLAMADVLYPLPIFCHPKPFSSGRMGEGVQVIGFHLEGSIQIMGKHLIFNEAPARLPYLLDRAYALIDHCQSNGVMLGDGAEFGMGAGEIIAVAHRPPSTHYPKGTIELTLREREGVFQLQPDGAAPLPDEIGMSEVNVQSAAALNVAPGQAPATMGSARTGNPIDDFFSAPDSAASARRPEGMPNMGAADGAAALREASRERLFEEQIASNRRTQNFNALGSALMGGPGTMRVTGKAAEFYGWLSIALTAAVHPIAAVALAGVKLGFKLPYVAVAGMASMIWMGAVMSGADPSLGYIDLFSFMGGSGAGIGIPEFSTSLTPASGGGFQSPDASQGNGILDTILQFLGGPPGI